MNKYFLYIVLCFLLPFPSFSSEEEYYFALPAGHPFKEASFDAERAGGVALKFGERIEIVYTLVRDDTV